MKIRPLYMQENITVRDISKTKRFDDLTIKLVAEFKIVKTANLAGFVI